MTEWKTIESAPMDGTEIILTDGAFTHCGRWVPETDKNYPWRFLDWTSKDENCELNGWRCDDSGPTHWMPLPEPPKTDDEPQRFDEYGNYGENNPPLPMSSPSDKDYGC